MDATHAGTITFSQVPTGAACYPIHQSFHDLIVVAERFWNLDNKIAFRRRLSIVPKQNRVPFESGYSAMMRTPGEFQRRQANTHSRIICA
jgi:hypothetical protein